MEIKKASEDKRGEVWEINMNDGSNPWLLIHTKAGEKRGGEWHHSGQKLYVMRGAIVLYQVSKNEALDSATPMLVTEGVTTYIPERYAHWMIAVENSIHIESTTDYVDACEFENIRHNRHYIKEIRDKIMK